MLYLSWLWRKLIHKNFYFTYKQWLRCRAECSAILRECEMVEYQETPELKLPVSVGDTFSYRKKFNFITPVRRENGMLILEPSEAKPQIEKE